MRILVVSEKYWPYGGAELATHLILKMLRSYDSSMKIDVLTGSKNPERILGVNYIYSPLLDVPTKLHLWKNLVLLSKFHWFNRLVKESDIVYIPRVAYPVIPLAKKYRKRVVVHLHNYQPIEFQSIITFNSEEEYGYGILGAMKYSLHLEVLEYRDLKRALTSSLTSPSNVFCKLWLSSVDEVICVSKKQAEIIERRIPELTRKIRVISNPLPKVPLVKKELKNPAFMYLGGDSYIKGFQILLKASQKLLKQGYSLELLLVGRFKDMDRLIITKLNRRFNGAYNLLGYLKYEKVLKLHSKSYALLFPSICEEPLPYAIVESMLAGTIPIASRVGGIPEIVQGTYAERMLFPPGDVNELIDRMENVFSLSKEQLKDFGVSLREVVLKRFDEDNIKKQLLKVFGNNRT